jgi:hypothetical protein
MRSRSTRPQPKPRGVRNERAAWSIERLALDVLHTCKPRDQLVNLSCRLQQPVGFPDGSISGIVQATIPKNLSAGTLLTDIRERLRADLEASYAHRYCGHAARARLL